MEHKLHKTIGEKLSGIDNCQILRDEACGGKQNISMFIDDVKNRKNRICKVDAAIIKNNQIKVIIEIEESGFNPTKICGKYLTSVLAKKYIRETDKIPLSDAGVLFVQVIDAKNFSDEKKSQLHLIEKLLKTMCFNQFNQFNYSMFLVEHDIDIEIEKMINTIKMFLF